MYVFFSPFFIHVSFARAEREREREREMACIDWLSKKQSTVETLVFGAKFVAMKHGTEKLRGLRYMLRMMGVLIEGTSFISGDKSLPLRTRPSPSLCQRKSATQSATMCAGSLLRWMKVDSHTLTCMTIGPTSWPKWPAAPNDADLLVYDIYDYQRQYQDQPQYLLPHLILRGLTKYAHSYPPSQHIWSASLESTSSTRKFCSLAQQESSVLSCM